MVYTEVLTRNGKKYYYRVLSVRDKDNREKVTRKKIYLGANLSVKNHLYYSLINLYPKNLFEKFMKL